MTSRHRDEHSPTRPLVIAAIVAGSLAIVAGRVESFPMGTLTANWISNGVEHTVTTNQLPDESYQAFSARHDEAVAVQQKKYPPDN